MNLETISTYKQQIFRNLLNPELYGSFIILIFIYLTAATLNTLIKHHIGIKEVDTDKKHQLYKNLAIKTALLCIISYFTLVC